MADRFTLAAQSTNFVPKLRGDLIVRRIGNEAIAWSALRREPAYLDPVATVMIDVIDGLATTEDLIEDVQVVLGIDHYSARSQINRLMAIFDEAGLLESSRRPELSWADMEGLLPEPNW